MTREDWASTWASLLLLCFSDICISFTCRILSGKNKRGFLGRFKVSKHDSDLKRFQSVEIVLFGF
jgi:hypothetical protein